VRFSASRNSGVEEILQNWNPPRHYTSYRYNVLYTLSRPLAIIYPVNPLQACIYMYALRTVAHLLSTLGYGYIVPPIPTGTIGRVRLFWIINVLITRCACRTYIYISVCTILYVWFLIRYKRWPRAQEQANGKWREIDADGDIYVSENKRNMDGIKVYISPRKAEVLSNGVICVSKKNRDLLIFQ